MQPCLFELWPTKVGLGPRSTSVNNCLVRIFIGPGFFLLDLTESPMLIAMTTVNKT